MISKEAKDMLQFFRRRIPTTSEEGSLPEKTDDKTRLKQLLRHPEWDGSTVDNIFTFDPTTDFWDTKFRTSLTSIPLITHNLLVPGAEEEALSILERRVETLFRYREGSVYHGGRREVLSWMQGWMLSNHALIGTSTSLDEIFARHFPEIAANVGLKWCPDIHPMLSQGLACGWPLSTLAFEKMMLSEGVKAMLPHVLRGVVIGAIRRRLARDTSLFKTRPTLVEFVTLVVLPKAAEQTSGFHDKEADLLCGLIFSLWPHLLSSHLQRWQMYSQQKPVSAHARWKACDWGDSVNATITAYRVWKHYIAVDKAILSHCFSCAKSPLHRLAPIRDLQAVVCLYLYGPHSFPKRFFRDVYSPTKGHHLCR